MYTTYSSQVPQSNRVSIGIDTRNENPANSVRYYFTDPCEIQFMFSVALIGNTASAEFAPLLSWLQDKQPSIALATSAATEVKRLRLIGDRYQIRERATVAALDLLRRHLG